MTSGPKAGRGRGRGRGEEVKTPLTPLQNTHQVALGSQNINQIKGQMKIEKQGGGENASLESGNERDGI